MNTVIYDIAPTNQPPTANFAGSPTSGTAPLTVQFTDLSSGEPTSWLWDFGDGSSSALQNPSYEYTTAGTYTVSLTATNAYGSDTETRTSYITVSEPGSVTIMHVAGIAVTREVAGGPNRIGVATVAIVDQNDQPMADATVVGLFNAPDNSIVSTVTGPDGLAVMTSGKTKNPPADWCFEVTNVSKSGASYDANANIVTTGCESDPAAKWAVGNLPDGFMLAQNHPNPFNPTTEISLYLESPAPVKIEIFNVLGQKVATLVDDNLGTGHHDFIWDGSSAASGIYLYRARIGDNVETRKMILQK
jgi:PKD repeat protein